MMRAAPVLIAVLLLVSVGCNREPDGVARANSPQKPATVGVISVVREDLAQHMNLAAEFRPYQEIDVHAKVPGYLRSITVDVGDHVRAGQLLATLEAPEWTQRLLEASAVEKGTELDVARAKAELNRAEAARKMRELSYSRLAAVAKGRPNLIAQAEIDDAQGRLHEADAQVATSRAALASVEQQVNVAGASRGNIDTMIKYLRITAPFSGLITKRYADLGAMVPAGTSSSALPVVRLSQVDRLRLVLPVPESVVPRIRVGAPVEVRVDALGRIFQGKVTRSTGRLESSTRTMETEVDVPNPKGMLKPGMYAYANIMLDRRQETLVLPIQAITGASSSRPDEVATRTILVVDAENRLQNREIRLGMETADRVEILEGLAEGEKVVVSQAGLKAGQHVTPQPSSLAGFGGH